jgi:hypothetical protein
MALHLLEYMEIDSPGEFNYQHYYESLEKLAGKKQIVGFKGFNFLQPSQEKSGYGITY